jgi:hypothetical protein
MRDEQDKPNNTDRTTTEQQQALPPAIALSFLLFSSPS